MRQFWRASIGALLISIGVKTSSQSQLDYTQIAKNTVQLGGFTIHFASKPGLPDWQDHAPAIRLLANQIPHMTPGPCLVLGYGAGVLPAAVALASAGQPVWASDPSWIAYRLCQQTLQMNQITQVHLVSGVSVLPDLAGYFQTVMIHLPKGRKLAQRWLLEAYHAARPGGAVYLAGANEQGIQPVIRDAAELFGSQSILEYKKGQRIARFIKNKNDCGWPAWAEEPGLQPGNWYHLEVETAQGRLNLVSAPGIFSYDRLDDGTRLLIETWQPSPNQRVLDLGCGCGILGILAARAGAAWVDLIDENLLAVAAARENLSAHQLNRAEAIPSDALSAVTGRKYDLILTNPPFHSGRGVDYSMTQAFIQQSWQALVPGGQLWLVANRFIPYETVLGRYFNEVICLADNPRYRVLRATR